MTKELIMPCDGFVFKILNRTSWRKKDDAYRVQINVEVAFDKMQMVGTLIYERERWTFMKLGYDREYSPMTQVTFLMRLNNVPDVAFERMVNHFEEEQAAQSTQAVTMQHIM